MGGLSNHFKGSGYAIHRTAIRPGRLPECCRNALADCLLAVRFLDASGKERLLPMKKCGVCGRYYAVCEDKFMAIGNLLKYDIVNLSE